MAREQKRDDGQTHVPASRRALGFRPRQVDLGREGGSILALPGRIKGKEADPIAAALFSGGAAVEAKPAITAPFEENPHVHACLKVKGAAVRQIPLRIWLGDPREDKGAQPLPPDHPLSRLFENPNPLMTMGEFGEAGLHHSGLDGEDFWFLLGADFQPLKFGPASRIPVPSYILPVRGKWVFPVVDAKTGFPVKWIGRTYAGGSLEADARAVVQFRDYNADDPLRGLGDVEALANEIDIGWQATRYQRGLLKNSGDPGGFIITETTLGPDEIAAAEEEAKDAFDVRNAGRWKVVSGKGTQYVPNSHSPRDMEFKEWKPWEREVVCEVIGVPPPLIGVLKDAALANIETSVEIFWDGGNGVQAYLRAREDVITSKFLRMLALPEAPRLFARYDLRGVKALKRDLIAKLTAAAGIRTALNASPNEVLKLVGVDVDPKALKYGDLHLTTAGQTTVDRIVEDAENPPDLEDPADAGDPADKGARIETREGDGEPEPSPEEVAAAARRAYWATRAGAVLYHGEASIRRAYRPWRRAIEREQFDIVREFAETGKLPSREADPATRAADDETPPENVDRLLFDLDGARRALDDALRPPIVEVWANALADIGDELDVEFPLNAKGPEVLAQIDTQMIKLVEGHASTLADQVRKVLQDALKEATSLGTLQERVGEVLDKMEAGLAGTFADRKSRANTIARTEAAAATNSARFLEMAHVGIRKHTWITSHDLAVRGTPGGDSPDAQFSHYELDGKTVEINQLFDAEKHPGLRRPHDPEAAAGDTINCRCLTMPERIEDDNS